MYVIVVISSNETLEIIKSQDFADCVEFLQNLHAKYVKDSIQVLYAAPTLLKVEHPDYLEPIVIKITEM